MLKKQFNQLCKNLYLKYWCFENILTEYQLFMIVLSTAYICRNKNAKINKLESYLNEPVYIELKKYNILKILSKYNKYYKWVQLQAIKGLRSSSII